MVEFNHPYFIPEERQYHSVEGPKNAQIEEPIFPISEVGQTIPEFDPSGKHKNLMQVAQAAIRGGAGKLQIVMMVPPASTGIGMHMYGKDVREAIREVVKANEALVVGIEMPTRTVTNVTGIQQNKMDEEARKNNLDQIKSTIEFCADVFQGGGTDLVSFEFPRNLVDASWNKKLGEDKMLFESFKGEDKHAVIHFVDGRSGQIHAIPIGEGVHIKLDPSTGEPTEEHKKWTWDDFKKIAKSKNSDPHDLFKKYYFETQMKIARSEAGRRQKMLENDPNYNKYLRLKKENKLDSMTDKDRTDIEDQIGYIESEKRMELEQKERIAKLEPLTTFGKKKAIEGYVELGMYAKEEQDSRKNMKKPLYVGPEIGHPHSYGGHPQEFIEIIKEARKVMAKKLEDQGYKKKVAEKEAKSHIKGCFDTGHVGMWLKHFRPDLSYKERVKEFNKWFLKQTEEIAKEDIVGTIQIVDAHGGEHGHLPPGQGIFPIAEAMKIFKKHGFTGHIVSEGHEEEKYGEGRIRSQAWRSLGAKIGPGYGAPSFSQIENAYMGRTQSPKQMFGSYAPPFGQYQSWSEIPFE